MHSTYNNSYTIRIKCNHFIYAQSWTQGSLLVVIHMTQLCKRNQLPPKRTPLKEWSRGTQYLITRGPESHRLPQTFRFVATFFQVHMDKLF
ncbi:hypothetical protein VNO80_22009 [Phaseolus coccineus]|uniref:Uncharacterized protein n=1 Tax=Phaseolus coccineus TaxID=3886 RepID=A0AAN9QTV9_PHACN